MKQIRRISLRWILLLVVVAVAAGFFARAWAFSFDNDSGKSICKWIQGFNDSLLEAVVKEGLENNFDVSRALARLEAAKASIAGAKAELKPVLNLRARTIGIQGLENSVADSFGGIVSLDLTWDLDVWGEKETRLASEQVQLKAQETNSSFVKRMIAKEIVKTWFLAIETQSQVKLTRNLADNYRRVFNIVRFKYEQGVASKQDVYLMKADSTQSEEAYIQAKGAHDETLRALELLLGRYPEGKIQIAQELPKPPQDLLEIVPLAILEKRDDIMAAKYRYDAVSLNLDCVKQKSYPDLEIFSSLTKASAELNSLTNDDNTLLTVGAGAKVSLYDGGMNQADVAAALAKQEEALVNYNAKSFKVLHEVEAALKNARLLQKRKKSYKTAYEELLNAFILVRKRYQAGKVDIITFINLMLRVNHVKIKCVHLEAAYLSQLADLYFSSEKMVK